MDSYEKAWQSQEQGNFEAEIVPVEIPTRKPLTSKEGLKKLRPAFKKDDLVTVGNASKIADGASEWAKPPSVWGVVKP